MTFQVKKMIGEIQRGVPIPEAAKPAGKKGPFRKAIESMQVGDCFVVAQETLSTAQVYQRAKSAAQGARASVTIRQVEGGTGVWRVK